MGNKNLIDYSAALEKQKRIRVFMDGIDWQHHLGHDSKGTPTFPSLAATKREKGCLAKGGRCGVVEVEVRLISWVEEQDLHAEIAAREAGVEKSLAATPPVAAPSTDKRDAEYICKCGVRVVPHRCADGTDF